MAEGPSKKGSLLIPAVVRNLFTVRTMTEEPPPIPNLKEVEDDEKNRWKTRGDRAISQRGRACEVHEKLISARGVIS